MAASQVEQVFKYVPASTTTIWVMTSAWFNRPRGVTCDKSAKIGLSFIMGILALFCWVRASVNLYVCRKNKRCTCKGWAWKLLATWEGAAVTCMFLAIALVTPPGSTCLFPSATEAGSSIPVFTTYNILAIATLGAFGLPQLLGWLMTAVESIGCKVRTAAPAPAKEAPFLVSGEAPWYIQVYAMTRRAFRSDKLELYLWQLLPTSAVMVYQVSTAYYTDGRTAQCNASEQSWLIAFIAIAALISAFLNLESYERSRQDLHAENPNTSLFRQTWWYNLLAIVQSGFTTCAFVGIALLTPPGSTCLFPQTAENSTMQNLALYILLPMAGVAVTLAAIKAFVIDVDEEAHFDDEVTQQLATMPRSDDPEQAAENKLLGAPAGGYAITASTMLPEDEDITIHHHEDKLPTV